MGYITLNQRIYLSILIMIKESTFNARLQALKDEVYKHSHTEELLNIMEEQALDDTYFIINSY